MRIARLRMRPYQAVRVTQQRVHLRLLSTLTGDQTDDTNFIPLQIGLPLPGNKADALVINGMTFEIDNVFYKCRLEPVGITKHIITRKKEQLQYHNDYLTQSLEAKQKIDLAATKSASRKLWASFLYLFLQSAAVAKLTFYSRFGWDVMEPICYFVTFYTAVGGLVFFQYNKIEYSYPALFSFLARKKRTKLYKKYKFDIDKFKRVQGHVERIQKELDSITIKTNERSISALNLKKSAAMEGVENKYGSEICENTAEAIVRGAVTVPPDIIESGLWTQHVHSQTGKIYYHSIVSGETRWTRPDGFSL